MLTKIKMFNIKMKDKFYTCMYQYWMSEAEGFAKLGRYDEVERCHELATKYLIKECDLVMRSIGRA